MRTVMELSGRILKPGIYTGILISIEASIDNKHAGVVFQIGDKNYGGKVSINEQTDLRFLKEHEIKLHTVKRRSGYDFPDYHVSEVEEAKLKD